MRRVRLFLFAAAVSAVTLAASWFQARYVILDWKLYPKSATVLVLPEGLPKAWRRLSGFPNLRFLDLRGTPTAARDYDRAAQQLPGCRILWDLAFQDGSVPADTRALTLSRLSDEDIPLLTHLPRLQTVDAAACRDYPQLMALCDALPHCRVCYQVDLGGVLCGCEELTLTPGVCSREALEAGLALLPRAKEVDLRCTGLPPAEAEALADAHPCLRFLWNLEIGGKRFPTNSQVLDLSGIPLESTQEVEDLLPYLPETEKIILCDCGIASPELAELGARHPEIRFVWRVKLGPLSARTDDTWFAPITHHQLIGGHDVDELKYCTDMECIDLGHCWIRDCEWARGMKNLRYLVLADSQVTDLSPLSELKKLAYLEIFVTPIRDYSPLLGCTGLEDLNLGYTFGDPTPIARMTWLKNLWWGGIHSVPWVGGQSPSALLRTSLPDTRITLYSGSSTGLGWRNLPHYYEMRDRIGMYYMKG